jgi:hypothetical protein
MQNLMVASQEKDDRRVWDGISVSGNFRMPDSQPYNFSFRSPNKDDHPKDHGIADAVFTLLESTTPSCELNNYLEQLTVYLQFGLPARVMPGKPFTIRFYGALSINHWWEREGLLTSLPTDQELLIDMTNLSGMGTIFYPQFQALLKRVPVITWIASAEAGKQLAALGVNPEKIEIRQGANSCGTLQGKRFARRWTLL